jgi:hypothetical protein
MSFLTKTLFIQRIYFSSGQIVDSVFQVVGSAVTWVTTPPKTCNIRVDFEYADFRFLRLPTREPTTLSNQISP